MLTPPQHRLVEDRFPVHGRPKSSGILRHVFIPAVMCLLVDEALHRVHRVAVVPLHLTVVRRRIRSGASPVNLEQLTDSTEKLALEIPPPSP